MMRGRTPAIVVALACFAVSGAPAYGDTSSDVEDLMTWMSGHFSSAKQVAEDPEARLRYVYGTRVHIPDVPGETMYLEWHAGGPDGDIDSQRIWAYEAMDDHIVMRFYTFYERADAVLTGIRTAADVNVEAVSALTLEDFYGYPDECSFVLRRKGNVIEGKNGTGECRIFNRSLDVWMRPDVTVRFEPGRIWEAGTYVYERDDGGPPPKTLEVVQDFRWIE